MIFDSLTSAAKWVSKQLGDNDYKNRTANISTACKNKTRKAYNYYWEYAD